MSISRRKALKTLGAVPLVAGFTWTPAEAEQAQQKSAAARAGATAAKKPFKPAFFTPHEWATVRMLVDLIIPKDERSGSATDAGVPEFMDFMMLDQPTHQDAMRGGLRWLDTECVERFSKRFVECTPADRATLLDAIAWPEKASPLLSQGVAFFNAFRDLTASGFWSSKMGVGDLQYLGNVPNPEWNGCPPEALEHIGIKA